MNVNDPKEMAERVSRLMSERDAALGKAADAERRATDQEEKWRDEIIAARGARDSAGCQVSELTIRLEKEKDQYDDLERIERETKAATDMSISTLQGMIKDRDCQNKELAAKVERKGTALRGALDASEKWRRRAVDAECQVDELKQQKAFSEAKAKARRMILDKGCYACQKRIEIETSYLCFHCKLYVCAECALAHFGESHDTSKGSNG